jgi:hypothetical protein
MALYIEKNMNDMETAHEQWITFFDFEGIGAGG